MTIEDVKREFLENSYVELAVKGWKKNKNVPGAMSGVFVDFSEKEVEEILNPFFTSFNDYGYRCYTVYHYETRSMGFYIHKENEPFEKKPIKID